MRKTLFNLGFEARLAAGVADLGSNRDAAECKHIVIGLTFLKHLTDAFEVINHELEAQKTNGTDTLDRDEYRAAGVVLVNASMSSNPGESEAALCCKPGVRAT